MFSDRSAWVQSAVVRPPWEIDMYGAFLSQTRRRMYVYAYTTPGVRTHELLSLATSDQTSVSEVLSYVLQN